MGPAGVAENLRELVRPNNMIAEFMSLMAPTTLVNAFGRGETS